MNSDFDLSKVNGDIWLRCSTSVPSFMKIELEIFREIAPARPRQQTNKHDQSQYLLEAVVTVTTTIIIIIIIITKSDSKNTEVLTLFNTIINFINSSSPSSTSAAMQYHH